jgi:hypothetical protein
VGVAEGNSVGEFGEVVEPFVLVGGGADLHKFTPGVEGQYFTTRKGDVKPLESQNGCVR